jgi:hypothetical protein
VTTTSKVTASIPPNTGGTSTITAMATSSVPLTEAEFFLDDPGCTTGQGVSLNITNVGPGTYRLTGGMTVTPNIPTGPHALFVRAGYETASGKVWSAAAVAPLYVDRAWPLLTSQQTNHMAIRALQQPLMLDFVLADDFSEVLVGGIELRPVAGTSTRPVYTEIRQGLPLGPYRWTWMPGPEIPAGVYRVAVAVADQARNAHTYTLNDQIVVV